MPSKCYLGQNYKYRHQNYGMHKLLQWDLKCWTLLRQSASGMLWGWCFMEKFGKFSRLDAISSYISMNWSKFPEDRGKGGSLVVRCEVRNSSFMYKELCTVFLTLPSWSEEILTSGIFLLSTSSFWLPFSCQMSTTPIWLVWKCF